MCHQNHSSTDTTSFLIDIIYSHSYWHLPAHSLLAQEQQSWVNLGGFGVCFSVVVVFFCLFVYVFVFIIIVVVVFKFFINVTKSNMNCQNNTLSDFSSQSARCTNDHLNTYSFICVPIKTLCKIRKLPSMRVVKNINYV